MTKVALGLLSAAALAATFLLVRQQREVEPRKPTLAAGKTGPAHLSVERIRELGL